jgi:release factor glutamine methyltransferase
MLVGDLATALAAGAFDLVLSNPPYIPAAALPSLSPEVREHEPREALVAGGSGISLIERILHELAPLSSGTPLVLEIGHDQLSRVQECAARSPFSIDGIRRDYAGYPRIVVLLRR